MSQGGRLRIMRGKDWADPVRPARREVREAVPETAGDRPPVLFVPGYGYGAWAFEEHWLEHAAQRGFPAYAMSLRGHGGSEAVPDATLRAYAHDVVQVAASLPRQAVLVGHGAGALVVTRALARYPARAGVLVAPVLGGAGVLAANLRHNPFGTLPALFGARVRWRARQLFSAGLPAETARGYLARLGGAGGRAQWQLLRPGPGEPAVGDPPDAGAGQPRRPGGAGGGAQPGGAALRWRTSALSRDGTRDDARRALARADRRDPGLAGEAAAARLRAPAHSSVTRASSSGPCRESSADR